MLVSQQMEPVAASLPVKGTVAHGHHRHCAHLTKMRKRRMPLPRYSTTLAGPAAAAVAAAAAAATAAALLPAAAEPACGSLAAAAAAVCRWRLQALAVN